LADDILPLFGILFPYLELTLPYEGLCGTYTPGRELSSKGDAERQMPDARREVPSSLASGASICRYWRGDVRRTYSGKFDARRLMSEVV
jgi:hypothetical protein